MNYKIILLALFVGSLLLMSYARTQRKKRIIFFGDSITQAAVNPNGYIDQLNTMLKQKGLDVNYELTGAGVSGNKVYDLYLRMEGDVISKNPDIVVIYICVNDVWHKRTTGTGTDYDKFGKLYDAIVNRMNAANIKVIICTPATIGEKTDFSNELDGDMNKYSQYIRNYANEHHLPLVDLRKAFLDYNLIHNTENKDKGILTTDGVHLNERGNQLVAERMWEQVGALK
ncbi:MAG: family lipolytic protein [Chitinophagaceae bacterium]|nr:family lipolytic protein [Chitinophagaceae bacterium]